MKKHLGLVAAFALALVSAAWAGQQDFILVNRTGVDIAQIFISSAAVDNWEEDLLGEDEILADGGKLNIHFTPDAEAELWDIRVVDPEGTAIDWKELDLTAISKVTLKFEDGEPTADLK